MLKTYRNKKTQTQKIQSDKLCNNQYVVPANARAVHYLSILAMTTKSPRAYLQGRIIPSKSRSFWQLHAATKRESDIRKQTAGRFNTFVAV